MDLINDLGTDLAFALLVEKRYRKNIDSEEARSLIRRVKSLLESVSVDSSARSPRPENTDSYGAH